MKCIIKWGVGLVILLLVMVIGTLFLLTTPPGERWIADLLEEKIGKALNCRIQIGNLKTNLISHLTITDFTVQTTFKTDSIPLLTLPEGKIQYKLADLLKGKLTVTFVKVNRPSVYISRDSSGTLNLPTLPVTSGKEKKSKSSRIAPRMEHLTLLEGTLEFQDRTEKAPDAAINGIQIQLNCLEDSIFQYELLTDSSSFIYHHQPISSGGIFAIGQIEKATFRLDTLICYLPELILTGSTAVDHSDPQMPLVGKLEIRGDPGAILNITRPSLPERLFPIHGEVKLLLELAGTVKQPDISLSLHSPSLRCSDLLIDDLNLHSAYQDSTCQIHQLTANIFNGKLDLSGSLSLDSLRKFYLNSKTSLVDIAALWQYIYHRPSPYQGSVEGLFSLQGNWAELNQSNIKAEFRLYNVHYYGKKLKDLYAKLEADKGAALFIMEGEGISANGGLRIIKDQIKGQFTADFSQLGPTVGFLNIPGLTGDLTASGTLQGAIDNPEIQAVVQAENVLYQNFPLNSLNAKIRFAGQKLTIDNVNFQGSRQITDTSQAIFGITDLSGIFAYRGLLQGTLDDPQGQIEIELLQPAYKTIRFDEGHLSVIFENQRIALAPCKLRRDSLSFITFINFDISEYSGAGNLLVLNQTNGDSLLILGANFDLAGLNQISTSAIVTCPELAKLTPLLPGFPPLSGNLQAKLQTKGNLENPYGEINVHWQNPSLGAATLDSIITFATLNRRYIEIPELQFFKGEHESRINTKIGITWDDKHQPSVSKNSMVEGEGHGDDFQLAFINPFLPKNIILDGTSSYDLNWSGTISKPQIEGRITLENGAVAFGDTSERIRELNATASILDNALIIGRFDGYISDIPFKLEGSLHYPDQHSFDLEARLTLAQIGFLIANGSISREKVQISTEAQNVDLQFLQPLLSPVSQLSGVLNARMEVNGSPSDPQLDGFLEIRDLSLQPKSIPDSLSQGFINLHFDGNNIWIDSLFAIAGKGTIFASGELIHADKKIQSVNLHFALRNIEISQPKVFSFIVKSADLTYQGDAERTTFAGDVFLDKSKILINFQPQAILPFAKRVQRPSPDLPEFLNRTRFDIRLRDSKDVWLDNNIARLQLRPEISVIGAPSQPNLTGRLTVIEGYVLFLDRKFKIVRGIVDFSDPERINPILNILAKTTIRSYKALESTSYEVQLSVTGTLDQPLVETISNPPLEYSDIISLLTLGTTREQFTEKSLDGDETSKTDILLERAGELSSQKISSYLSRNLTSLTGLDEISIEGNLFRFGKSWGPQLVASKKITDRMEVIYTTNAGYFNEKNIRVDYRLSKYFSVESETDQRGRAGLDLKYGISFK